MFRSVNEMVRPLEPTWMRILCECGDGTCRDHIVSVRTLTPSTRAGDAVPDSTGHESVETENVVSKHLEYWIVEKLPGLPARIARATEPNGS